MTSLRCGAFPCRRSGEPPRLASTRGRSGSTTGRAPWENANHPRVIAFTEAVQAQLLDRFQEKGVEVSLEIEEPEFDDRSPLYAMAAQAVPIPLKNIERREILGLPPFGEKAINPDTGIAYDEEVWLPSMTTMMFVAPEKGIPVGSPLLEPPPAPEPPPVGEAPPEGGSINEAASAASAAVEALGPGKAKVSDRGRALHSALVSLRGSLDERFTPKAKRAVAEVLREQQIEVAQKVKANAAHLMKNPGDTKSWWDAAKWDREMKKALGAPLSAMAEALDVALQSSLRKAERKAGPVRAVEYALEKSGKRITGINHTTRDGVLGIVRKVVGSSIEQGLSNAVAGDVLEEAIGDAALFDEYRSEMIARTEMMFSYNDATIGSYRDLDVTQVQAIDGDEFDAECAARDGQIFDIEEAEGIEDHPNGTLDWIPIIPEEEVEEKAVLPAPSLLPFLSSLSAALSVEQEQKERERQESLKAVTDREDRLLQAISLTNIRVTDGLRDLAQSIEARPLVVNVPTRNVHKKILRDAEGRIIGSHEVN